MNKSFSNTILSVRNLRAGYHGVPVLHDVNLGIEEGSCVGVLGHNGMGKSTFLRALMGYIPLFGGSIHFDEKDISDLEPWRRARLGIGYLPQGRGIFVNLSVRENLCMAFNPDTSDSNENVAVERAVTRFPILESLLRNPGGTLSGGEQQILALARALIAEPILLLLDEPTEGIQPSIIAEIAEILTNIREETGLSLLLVEQNSDFIHALADQVIRIENGIIIQSERKELIEPDKPSLRAPTPNSDSVTQTPRTNIAKPIPNKHEMVNRENFMTVKRPTLHQLRDIASDLHFHMDDAEIAQYLDIMQGTLDAYDVVDSMPDELPKVKYPRTSGQQPDAADNPLNAWHMKCEVRGASSGPLKGKEIVLKDTICLSGVRMMNGTSVLEGYVPDVDATVVSRILDAGGTIVGKAHCESLSLSGGSHTNSTGPVCNPWKPTHSSGGSSSGCGVLVGAGEVPMAIGGDQGGSIRIPSSWSGCYGMKPTHGLVPYSGVMSIEATIDTIGPMTATVSDNALLLEVIAGQQEDMLDPRQYAPRVDSYTRQMTRGMADLRIGVVKEGFELPSSEPDVNDAVRVAADSFKKIGARVEEISIPLHKNGAAIWTPIALEGLTDFMMHGNAFGTNYRGLFITSLIDFYGNWRSRADELSPSLKVCMLIGEYFQKHYRGRYYGKAQNISRRLRAAYDAELDRFDLLLMPTLPMKATLLPPPDATLELYIQRAFEVIPNTAPFSCTGHPAMNVPCGLREGLPIGMMLIARHYDESAIYRAAYAFEQLKDWRDM